MRKQVATALACAGWLAGAPAAGADECLVNGSPVSPSTLASALELGSGLPGQLNGVPYSVVRYEQAAVQWTSCATECIVSDDPGEAQCGNLVANPVEDLVLLQYFGLPDPPALVEASASQAANGEWHAYALGLVSPSFEQTGGSASFTYQFGTREVFDVTASSAADMLPLDVQLRVGSHMGVHVCQGNLFGWIPSHSLRFRVTEESSSFPFTRVLVNELHSQFFGLYEVFPVEVRPDSTLIVDVWFRASANATGGQDIFGNQCAGGVATLDLALHTSDGIQVGFVPDPALTLAPRSGITYEPVPEPAGAPAASLLALLLLRAARRGSPQP